MKGKYVVTIRSREPKIAEFYYARMSLFIAIISFTFCGCGDDKPESIQSRIATIGNEEITVEDIEKRAAAANRIKDTPYSSPALRRHAPRLLMTDTAFAARAEREGILIAHEYVDKVMNRKRGAFNTLNAWQGYLDRINRTEAQLHNEIWVSLIRERVLDAVVGDVEVPENDVRAYYKKHREQFVQAEPEIRGCVFTVAVARDATRRARGKARSRAEARRQAWMEKYCDCRDGPGSDESDGGSGPNPVCWTKGAMTETVRSAFAAVESGAESEVIETERGYRIYQIKEKRAAEVLPYEQVREDIRYQLTRQRRAEARANARKKIIEEAKNAAR